MLLLYILLAMGGVMTTARAAKHRDRMRTVLGGLGTLLALLAILTGFSIGPIVALAALITILFAAIGVQQTPVTETEAPTV
jgi:hypothetical protein